MPESTWIVEPSACAVYEPPEGGAPPLLFIESGPNWVTLMPPVHRDDLSEFRRFLRDLAEAADGLRLMCHPAGEWGRKVFSDGASHPKSGD